MGPVDITPPPSLFVRKDSYVAADLDIEIGAELKFPNSPNPLIRRTTYVVFDAGDRFELRPLTLTVRIEGILQSRCG